MDFNGQVELLLRTLLPRFPRFLRRRGSSKESKTPFSPSRSGIWTLPDALRPERAWIGARVEQRWRAPSAVTEGDRDSAPGRPEAEPR